MAGKRKKRTGKDRKGTWRETFLEKVREVADEVVEPALRAAGATDEDVREMRRQAGQAAEDLGKGLKKVLLAIDDTYLPEKLRPLIGPVKTEVRRLMGERTDEEKEERDAPA
ncbi:MAG: hypothetical protein GYA36_19180 [Veillonellaceae bacterium]|nr:hypothetical protein [Veillonellaceae bacterium]